MKRNIGEGDSDVCVAGTQGRRQGGQSAAVGCCSEVVLAEREGEATGLAGGGVGWRVSTVERLRCEAMGRGHGVGRKRKRRIMIRVRVSIRIRVM